MLNFYIKEKEFKMMKNETGRSMVEMLGVLAIIGVLSVGGIAGYTMAMNKYRANEILNTASMLSMLSRSANGGMGGNFDTLANAGLEKPYGSVDMKSTDNGATITVSGADPAVMTAVTAASNGYLYTISAASTTTGGSDTEH